MLAPSGFRSPPQVIPPGRPASGPPLLVPPAFGLPRPLGSSLRPHAHYLRAPSPQVRWPHLGSPPPPPPAAPGPSALQPCYLGSVPAVQNRRSHCDLGSRTPAPGPRSGGQGGGWGPGTSLPLLEGCLAGLSGCHRTGVAWRAAGSRHSAWLHPATGSAQPRTPALYPRAGALTVRRLPRVS